MINTGCDALPCDGIREANNTSPLLYRPPKPTIILRGTITSDTTKSPPNICKSFLFT